MHGELKIRISFSLTVFHVPLRTYPTFPSYYSDIISNFDNVYFVSKRVQSITSEFCGIFCIHWIYIMSLGLDCESFLSDYTPDYVKNDVIVKNIVKSF